MAGESPLNLMRAEARRVPRRSGAATASASAPGRRLWIVAGAIAVIVVLAACWCGLWYYAASVADRTLASWVEQETAAGRAYSCGSEGISGFPFSIQVHCAQAAAALNSTQPPLAVDAKDVTFTAQIYRPNYLVGEFTGPLTVSTPGQPPSFVATWSLARMSVSGLPPESDAVSISIEQPHLDRGSGASAASLLAADDAELDARIVGGSADNHPVIDAVLHFTAASAPNVQALFAEPLQGDIEVIIGGLKDLSPKPLAARIREIQAAGGSIEIKSFRVARADAVVVGAGTLNVDAQGKLNGVISVAVYGIENIVPQLGIDKLINQGIDRLAGANGQSGKGLSALDRLVPGLNAVVSAGANASVVDDLKKMGQPTEIDQQPAIALPLRFSAGAVYLGMIRLGEVPALF